MNAESGGVHVAFQDDLNFNVIGFERRVYIHAVARRSARGGQKRLLHRLPRQRALQLAVKTQNSAFFQPPAPRSGLSARPAVLAPSCFTLVHLYRVPALVAYL